jgi:hypothetical protein
MRRRHVFYLWLIVLAVLCAVANLPRQWAFGLFSDAGLPFTFASWRGDDLTRFSVQNLLLDLLIAFGFAVGLALLCAWSRPPDKSN